MVILTQNSPVESSMTHDGLSLQGCVVHTERLQTWVKPRSLQYCENMMTESEMAFKDTFTAKAHIHTVKSLILSESFLFEILM